VKEEIIYRIALTKIPKIGPVLAKSLLNYFGNAKKIFCANPRERMKVSKVGQAIASAFENPDIIRSAEKEFDFVEKNGFDILFYLDDNYPRRLKHFDLSPVLLYYNGSANLNPNKTVAIVGTRNPTSSGRLMTEKLVKDLSALDVTIISGLAYGVDAVAHKACINENVETIGVLGHGLDRIYPQEHHHLSKRMIKNGGLLTEFGFGTIPDRQNFPMRNRIIAGMADVVIVVESKVRGGSIITAEFANEYSKDVFAVPGRPDDIYSQGCNALIKRTKAHLLENVEDLKYIMRWEENEKPKTVQRDLFQTLTTDELAIVDVVRMNKEIRIDEISFILSKNSSELAPLLLSLEFKGMIRSLPGSRYLII
jgi:DNA processing protein